KGYWHIVALSVGMSLLMIIYNNYLIPASFFIWLFLLYYFKRLGKTPLIFSLLFFLIFSVYIPDKNQIIYEVSFPKESTTLIGEIISPITISRTTISFHFLEQETNTKIQVFHFPDHDPPYHTEFSTLKYGANCQL